MGFNSGFKGLMGSNIQSKIGLRLLRNVDMVFTLLLAGVPAVARDDQWRNQKKSFSCVTKKTE